MWSRAPADERMAGERQAFLTSATSRGPLLVQCDWDQAQPRGFDMTVDYFGDQTVQAVATVLLAAIALLGMVLLAVGVIAQRGAQALVPAIVLSRAAARPMTHRASLRPPTERFAASLPTRAPPLSLQRPRRMSPQPDVAM